MATKGVLVDAGPLVAILNKRDQYHQIYTAEAAALRGPFLTCWPALTEAAYLLKNRSEMVEVLLGRVSGKIRLLWLDADDIDGISGVLATYSDQGFDLADASLMHLADRHGIETVFTIDHRHFSVYRTSRGSSLTLIPGK